MRVLSYRQYFLVDARSVIRSSIFFHPLSSFSFQPDEMSASENNCNKEIVVYISIKVEFFIQIRRSKRSLG